MWSQSYGFDTWGNRWVSANTGLPIYSYTPTVSTNFDAANRLNIRSSAYDPARRRQRLGVGAANEAGRDRGGSGDAERSPGWVTRTVVPATENIAVREANRLGAATRVTVAGPEPDVEPEIVSQEARPEMLHAQPAAVWMLSIELPPAAAAATEVGETE